MNIYTDMINMAMIFFEQSNC